MASEVYPLSLPEDAPIMADLGSVETCSGGSAVLPCLPPHGEALPVEGVSLKRQRGRAPAEVLYHSKRHQHGGSPLPSPSSSRFSAERVQLSSAPGPGGITYNLTLLQLQPADSGLYSCQLLLRGGPDTSTGLGTRAFFVSVQGGSNHCRGGGGKTPLLSYVVSPKFCFSGFGSFVAHVFWSLMSVSTPSAHTHSCY